LNSPDLNLQQSAYYNRGNTLYYAGENATDPAKRNDFWKRSVQDFDSALKLKADDADAKFNRFCEAKTRGSRGTAETKLSARRSAK
jgi:hypothetical protein